ncbi:hypothetical protein BC827DRAFT_1157824 [Russula dissimulans]|nr:hypothetical protein BC827DRAFT_1157824 [Russula dissimulans]
MMQAESDAHKEHIGQLEEENRRWQEHNNQLLTKYDHVDPTEFQSLKDEVESLRAETSTWEAQQATHAEQLTGQQEKVATLEKMSLRQKDPITKNNQTYRLQMGALATENTQLKSDLKTAWKEFATITEEQWSMMPSKLLPLLHLPMSHSPKRLHLCRSESRDQLLAEKETWKKPPEAPKTKVSQEQWEAEKVELVKSRDEAVTQAKAIREEMEKLREAH